MGDLAEEIFTIDEGIVAAEVTAIATLIVEGPKLGVRAETEIMRIAAESGSLGYTAIIAARVMAEVTGWSVGNAEGPQAHAIAKRASSFIFSAAMIKVHRAHAAGPGSGDHADTPDSL